LSFRALRITAAGQGIVHETFTMTADSLSLRSISKRLNNRGISPSPTARGQEVCDLASQRNSRNAAARPLQRQDCLEQKPARQAALH